LRYDQQQSDSYRTRTTTLVDSDRYVEQELARLMTADTDKNGLITWDEAAAYVREQFKNMRASAGDRTRPARQILALAQPGRDSVAFNELVPSAEALFRINRCRSQRRDLAGRADGLARQIARRAGSVRSRPPAESLC